MVDRINNEIEHGKFLTKDPEGIWNWSSPAGIVRADRRANLFVNVGKISQKDIVLEIGCGTGLFTRKVHDFTNANITAIDISEELLEIAKSKSNVAKYIIGDAMNLSFDDNSFDVVFGSSVLHHLEMERAMNEIFRVLKPGGRIIFAEPNMVNPQILIQKNIPFIKRMLGDSPDETAIIRWKFAKLMETLGYKEVNITPYDFLHPIVPKILIGFVSAIGKVVEKIPLIKEIAGSVIIFGRKPLI